MKPVLECVWPHLHWGNTEVKERRSRPRYKPGQIVPATGIYRVYHNRHRLMHEATFIQETHFPRCKKCNTQVRFAIVRPIHAKYVLPFRSTGLLEEWEEQSIKAG